MSRDLAGLARDIVDGNLYLTLGTADRDGRPWVTPVYFASADCTDFYWVSATDTIHSRNIAQRPEISIVIFDSRVPPYHGRAVYVSAMATVLTGDDLDRGLQSYPGPPERGATAVTLDDVSGASPYRMYRARATEHFILCPRQPRQPCALHGIAVDHRTVVTL